MKDVSTGIAAYLGLISVLIFGPALSFLGGWFGGTILNWCLGEWVMKGLTYIFGGDIGFTREMIPLACGVLTIFGGYFKASVTNNNK